MRKNVVSKYRKIARIILPGIFLLPIGACAEMPMKHSSTAKTGDLPAVQIGFDGKGSLFIKDGEGNMVRPTQVDFPINATAIEEIETITLIRVRGSHYYLMRVGGTYYKIHLP